MLTKVIFRSGSGSLLGVSLSGVETDSPISDVHTADLRVVRVDEPRTLRLVRALLKLGFEFAAHAVNPLPISQRS
jgi:hypothetical protein